MNKKQFLIHYFIITLSLLIGFIIGTFTMYYINEYENNINDRCKMYNAHNNFYEYRDKAINGVYFTRENFYCVWTKDRKLSDIQRTDYHETCHGYVFNNFSHFCLEPYGFTECS